MLFIQQNQNLLIQLIKKDDIDINKCVHQTGNVSPDCSFYANTAWKFIVFYVEIC